MLLSPQYRLPLLFHLTRPRLAIGAIRTFHCLLYLHTHLTQVDMLIADDSTRWVYQASVADIREIVGPRHSNDTRAIRAAVAGLQADPRLGLIELTADRRAVRFAFACDPEAECEDSSYLTLNIRHLAGFATPLEIHLYEIYQRIRMMRFPQAEILVADACHLYVEGRPTWARLKRMFLQSVLRVSTLVESPFVVEAAWWGSDTGPQKIRIRPQGPKSMWQPKNVFKCLPSSELYLVDKAGVQRLDKATVDQIVRAYAEKRAAAATGNRLARPW